MAQTPSDILTAAYHARSSQIADQTAAVVRALWVRYAANAPTAKDAYDGWMGPAVRQVMAGHVQQSELARAFYSALRKMEAPAAPSYIPRIAVEPDEDAIRSSLYYIAFVEGRPDDKSLDDYPIAEEAVRPERLNLIGGVAMTKAMNGGRLQIKEALDGDPAEFRGYYRELGPNPCGFCALLGTRHDYGKDSFDMSDVRFEGPGECKVHDHCHCVMRPYWAARALSPTHQQADALWIKVTKQHHGRNNRWLINEFSRQWREERAAAEDASMESSGAPEGRAA